MKYHIFLTVILAVLATAFAEEEVAEPEGARLLIAKHIHNKYLVEGMDVVVKVKYYLIFSFVPFVCFFFFFEEREIRSIAKSQVWNLYF